MSRPGFLLTYILELIPVSHLVLSLGNLTLLGGLIIQYINHINGYLALTCHNYSNEYIIEL